MDKVNTGGVTFRWDTTDECLIVTTAQGQYRLDPEATMELLIHLYDHRGSIFSANRLPGWARPEQTTNVAEEKQKRLSSPSTAPFVVEVDDLVETK